ncbi:MAG: hypothetical protein RIS87_82 [Pseudomonadota bacterium]|jgi:hypothetical protein
MTSNLNTKLEYSNSPPNSPLEALETMMASTCFCKLREKCDDKNGAECLKHRNLYAEAMLARGL